MQQINPRIWLRLYILAAWREEKKLAKTQRRKEKIDPFATCLPQAWRLCTFATLREKKLACHRQSVKENTSSFSLKGTLLLIFALYPCNPIFQLLI
jgi:hypothetical protein